MCGLCEAVIERHAHGQLRGLFCSCRAFNLYQVSFPLLVLGVADAVLQLAIRCEQQQALAVAV